jgi:membrane-bound lytic murein transglycosylase B
VGVDAPITDDSVVDTSLDGPTSTTTTSAPTSDAEPAGSPIPALAPTPDGLAEQLAAAEAAIRDPSSSDAAVTEQANLQQVAYRVVAERPTWQEPVVAALPTALREAARLQLAARAEFRSMNVNPPVELPVWRIVPPAPAEELLGYYQEAEDEFGVEWEYLAAINLVETGMGRIRGDSSAGAQGPMQFIPSTWERFGGGGDVTDPHDAIFGAARYLAHNGGSAADGNIAGALFNYNNDERYVRGVTDYAQIMQGDADTYRGFHQWQVWYASAAGDLVLPEGHHLATPVPAAQYAQDHPDRHRPYSQ